MIVNLILPSAMLREAADVSQGFISSLSAPWLHCQFQCHLMTPMKLTPACCNITSQVHLRQSSCLPFLLQENNALLVKAISNACQ